MSRVREPGEAAKRGPTYRLPRGRYLTLQRAADAYLERDRIAPPCWGAVS